MFSSPFMRGLSAACLIGGFAAGASAQVIDFETTQSGVVPTDDQILDRTVPFLVGSLEVRIGVDVDGDQVVDGDAFFEAVGTDGIDSFFNNSLGVNDTADPGFEAQLGDWFVRTVDENTPTTPSLIVDYSEPVTSAGAEIWDIEDRGSNGFEQWRVRAFDGNGMVVAELTTPVPQGNFRDGEPFQVTIESTEPFVRLIFDFVGDLEPGFRAGLAFNNFTADCSLCPAACSTCPEDNDQSGVVDVLDLLNLLAAWGPCGDAPCFEDSDCNGAVDVLDLLALLAAWGPCP